MERFELEERLQALEKFLKRQGMQSRLHGSKRCANFTMAELAESVSEARRRIRKDTGRY